MARRNRTTNNAAAETPKSKFIVHTKGIEDVHFIHRNIKAAVEFGIVIINLARHIVSKDKDAMGSKALKDMAQTKIVKPIEPIQEHRMDNSSPPNETDVPFLGDRVYG